MKKQTYFSFASLLFLGTYFSPSYAAFVLGGGYNTGSELRPIIAQSFNLGKTWSFPSTISSELSLSPSFAKNGRFSQTTCKDNTCLAVGSYDDGTSLTTPLIAVSNDGGKSWAYPQISPSLRELADYTKARLFAVSCRTSQACMAVGIYEYLDPSTGKATVPQALIAITKNGGKNWTFKTVGKGVQLIRVFNYKNNWFITRAPLIGQTSGGSTAVNGYPLYKSTNDGDSWTIPKPLISYPTAVITDLKCSGKFCLAVGGLFLITAIDVKYKPFLVMSNNGGTTWSMPNRIRTTTIQGLLFSASCSSTKCMAVGLSGNPLVGSMVRPLAYVTQNSGKTWSSSNIFATAPPSINTLAYAGMSGVACNNAVCFSTGVAVKLSIITQEFQLVPFLVVSKDWGKTWIYDKSIAINNKNGYIFNPTFNGNIGIFLGGKLNTTTMKDLDLSKQTPFVGISSNNGASWTYPLQIEKSTVFPPYSSFNGFDFISNFTSN